MEERIQKLISMAGLASRRKAEEWIYAGRVTVNGHEAVLGERADPERDDVRVDGVPMKNKSGHTYLMLNKPRGYVTTLSDEKGRKTVAELTADCAARVWPVGRLDMDSEGLLLLTDDGELTQCLTHPRHRVEKEYLVWVRGDARRAAPILRRDMVLDRGERVAGAQVRVGPERDGVTRLSIVICQGINRQVRRMCAQTGLEVLRLKRVREGELMLDRSLAPGKWRHLTEQEQKDLKLKAEMDR